MAFQEAYRFAFLTRQRCKRLCLNVRVVDAVGVLWRIVTLQDRMQGGSGSFGNVQENEIAVTHLRCAVTTANQLLLSNGPSAILRSACSSSIPAPCSIQRISGRNR